MAKRAKRVSKAYGTKLPAETQRITPSKGVRSTTGSTKAMSLGRQSVPTLSGEAWKYVGRPGFGGKIPGPHDGKLGVTRKMVKAPNKGITSPAAAKITSTHVDLIGAQSPRRVVQPLPGSPQKFDNAGRKSIATPRKSRPVYSNKPGKVTRSPGS